MLSKNSWKVYRCTPFFWYNTFFFPIDPDQNVLPTIGFRTVSLKHKSYSVKIYDLGGSSQIRALWPKYYNDVNDLHRFSKPIIIVTNRYCNKNNIRCSAAISVLTANRNFLILFVSFDIF